MWRGGMSRESILRDCILEPCYFCYSLAFTTNGILLHSSRPDQAISLESINFASGLEKLLYLTSVEFDI